MIDQRNPTVRRRVSRDGSLKKQRRLFVRFLIHGNFGELGKDIGIRRMLDKPVQKCLAGTDEIAGSQRGRRKVNDGP